MGRRERDSILIARTSSPMPNRVCVFVHTHTLLTARFSLRRNECASDCSRWDLLLTSTCMCARMVPLSWLACACMLVDIININSSTVGKRQCSPRLFASIITSDRLRNSALVYCIDVHVCVHALHMHKCAAHSATVCTQTRCNNRW